MVDVAALGMSIDSSQADKGALALTRLTTAAKRAEVATAKAAYAQADATLAAAKATATSTAEDIKAATASKNKAAATLAAARAAAAMASATQASSAVIAAQSNAIRTGFATALNQAVQSINAVKTANNALGVSMNSLLNPANKSAAALAAQTAAAKKTGAAIAMNRQLMYQMVDITQGIPLAFQSPLYGLQNIAIQMAQVGQLYYGQGGMQRALKDMGAMVVSAGAKVLSLLTPMRMLGLGIVAVGATLIASGLSWLSYSKNLDDAAKQADSTIRSLSGLSAAASFKGIDDDEFLSATKKLAENIYDAKTGAGSLASLLALNGQRAGTFEQTLGSVADIIAKTTSNQQALNLLSQAGLPATQQWVKFMKQGSAGIAEAVAQANTFGSAANDNMLAKAKEFGEAWDKAIRNLSLGFKSLFVDVLSGFQKISDKATSFLIWFDKKTGGSGDFIPQNILKNAMTGATSDGSRMTGADASGHYGAFGNTFKAPTTPGAAVDPEVVRRQIAAQQAYLGILGQTLTVQQQIKSVELQIAQYHLDPANQRLSKGQVDNLKRLAEERALGIDQIKASTDALNVEAATMGMSAGAAAAYAAVQTKINEAIRAGNPLKAEEIAKLQESANAYGAAVQRASDLAFARDATKGFLSDLRSGLQNGQGFWKSFGNAAMNVLNKIIDKINGQLVDALFSMGSAGKTGGGIGGLFASLFKFAGGGVMTSKGAMPLKKYDKGGIANSPQIAMYGEGKSPEAYVPLPDGRRIPVNIKSSGGGGNNRSVAISYNIDASGADQAAIIRLEKGLAQTTQTVAKHLNTHDTLVQSSVTTYRRNNPGAP